MMMKKKRKEKSFLSARINSPGRSAGNRISLGWPRLLYRECHSGFVIISLTLPVPREGSEAWRWYKGPGALKRLRQWLNHSPPKTVHRPEVGRALGSNAPRPELTTGSEEHAVRPEINWQLPEERGLSCTHPESKQSEIGDIYHHLDFQCGFFVFTFKFQDLKKNSI